MFTTGSNIIHRCCSQRVGRRSSVTDSVVDMGIAWLTQIVCDTNDKTISYIHWVVIEPKSSVVRSQG